VTDHKSSLPEGYVVVTGASRGLGLGIVSCLAIRGWTVIAASRSCSEPLQQLINQMQGKVVFRQLDLTDHKSLHPFATAILTEYGAPFGLINNASIAFAGVLGTQHESEIESMLSVNVTGPIILTKYLSRAMLSHQRGRIVNITSIIANSGYSGLSVYGATKAAMNGFTRSLARELGRVKITVNAIAPGYLATDMSSALSVEQLNQVARRSSLKRLTTIDEVAAAVSFLLSESAASITGTIMTVDAGATA